MLARSEINCIEIIVPAAASPTVTAGRSHSNTHDSEVLAMTRLQTVIFAVTVKFMRFASPAQMTVAFWVSCLGMGNRVCIPLAGPSFGKPPMVCELLPASGM